MKSLKEKILSFAMKEINKERDKFMSGMKHQYYTYADDYYELLLYLNGTISEENHQLKQENHQLKEENKKLLNKLYGRN